MTETPVHSSPFWFLTDRRDGPNLYPRSRTPTHGTPEGVDRTTGTGVPTEDPPTPCRHRPSTGHLRLHLRAGRRGGTPVPPVPRILDRPPAETYKNNGQQTLRSQAVSGTMSPQCCTH